MGYFRIVDCFDWYDGLVLGTVEVPESAALCVASLIAFDPNLRRRAFALFPISSNAADLARHELKRSILRATAVLRAAAHQSQTVRVSILEGEDRLVGERQIRAVEVEGVMIPVLPLEWELVLAVVLDQRSRIEELQAYFALYGFDNRLLTRLLREGRVEHATEEAVWAVVEEHA